ncbi:RNA polymerase, sigma-24 subunit, ECF subfamily [Pseudonocardia sp. N23]|nr:RNA polymerase, sigma-24 subunit, ECF subfamily [Pseudonocardia sp. N23]
MQEHRRELHVHCYRMLGSFDEAEDLVQETFLRAWKARGQFDEATNLRAWLYRIATNACLDALRRRKRAVPKSESPAEVTWLQPYPDQLLDAVAPSDERPDVVAVARETIGLAFLAAIQLLPARQRAVLVLRDVLEWSAAETADLLEMTVPAANSALQRARATLRERLPADHGDWQAPLPTDEEQALLERFVRAHTTGDPDELVALVRHDIRVTMPPAPMEYNGLDELWPLFERATSGFDGDWRLLPTAANRMPAAASYLRPPGGTEYLPYKLDVLRIVDGRIAEITTFGPSRFADHGLPAALAP